MGEQLEERRTFEDTKTNQKEFVELMQKLIEENRPLNDEEHEVFYDIVCNSVLGHGYQKICYTIHTEPPIPGAEGESHSLGNVIEATITLMMQKGNTYNIKSFYKKDVTIPISEIWKCFFKDTIKVFNNALKDSIMSSKEIDVQNQNPVKGVDIKKTNYRI